MSLPSLVKTWSYDVNNIFTWAGIEEGAQKLGFNLKEALVTAGWSVIASCDKSSVKNVGDASPDLWVAYTDIVRESSGDHSWCAIYNSTLDFTLLIDCLSSYDYNYDFYFIDGTLNTDGTTSARPTSVSGDEEFLSNIEVCPGRSTSGTQSAWHCIYSTDELAFRFVLGSDGTTPGCFNLFIQRPSNTPDLWVDPVVGSLVAAATGVNQFLASNYYYAKTDLHCLVNGTFYNMYISGECFYNSRLPVSLAAGVSPCDLSTDNGYLILPMGLIGNDVGVRGSNGRLDDMWWAPQIMNIGDTLPGGGSKTFVCFGQFIFPWNGSAPVLS